MAARQVLVEETDRLEDVELRHVYVRRSEDDLIVVASIQIVGEVGPSRFIDLQERLRRRLDEPGLRLQLRVARAELIEVGAPEPSKLTDAAR